MGKGVLGWGPEGRLAMYAGVAVGLAPDIRDVSCVVREVPRGDKGDGLAY